MLLLVVIYLYLLDRTVVYVSFGGLLMKLSGTASNMAKIDPDIQLYMLVRKHD